MQILKIFEAFYTECVQCEDVEYFFEIQYFDMLLMCSRISNLKMKSDFEYPGAHQPQVSRINCSSLK